MKNHSTDAAARRSIENEVKRAPWKTQQEVANATGASRSWVAEVIGDSPELEALRDAYRKSIDLDASTVTLQQLAAVVDLADDGEPIVADRLRQSSSLGDLERVRIELVPADDRDDEP